MKNRGTMIFVFLIAVSVLTSCGNHKTIIENNDTDKKEAVVEQIYRDEYLGKWYGFGTDNTVTETLELSKVDEKTVMITYHDGQTNEIVFEKPDYAECKENNVSNDKETKSIYTFGSDNQGDYFEFHSVTVSDGKQCSESMYCYRNAVIIEDGQTVESLTANGEMLEKGYFNARYNALETDSIPGDSQYEMNEASAQIYQEYDTLLNDIYTCLNYMLPYAEFCELEKDEVNWIKEKENAVRDEEKDYFMYDENGKITGRGSMAPLAMNCVNIDYTKKRCEYLISLIK